MSAPYALIEKRLKPIYDYLDNRNYKKALNEADKVLKKQKDLLAAKALKVIAMHRLARPEEAFELSQQVIAEKPIDENSLQGMSLYYKETNRSELISVMYEQAASLVDNNEEILTHLFMSYVRQNEFQKMKATAGLLYKKYRSNPYFFWNVMSSFLQGHTAKDETLAMKMHFPLARKMIEKHINDGNIGAGAEVRLYLLVLEGMKKYETALNVLESDLAKRFLPPEIAGSTPYKIKLLGHLERHKEINILSQQLLKELPDSWNHALTYIDSFEQLVLDHSKHDANGSVGYHWQIKDAVDFINQLVDDEGGRGLIRGPYLLQLELARRLKNIGKLEEGIDAGLKPVEGLLLSYTNCFLHKPCCFFDIHSYLSLLDSATDVDQFLNKLDENGSWKKPDSKLTFDDYARRITCFMIARSLGAHEKMSLDEKLKLVEEKLLQREAFTSTGIWNQDQQIVIDFHLLAALFILLDIYYENDETFILWRCAMLLEKSISSAPTNKTTKLYLVRIYSKLGMFLPCADLFESLEIKYVQHDSLGFALSRFMTSLGHYDVASQIFQVVRNFFRSQMKESMDCLLTCYQNGTFRQIIEFMKYRKDAKNSFHNQMTKMEMVLLELIYQFNPNDHLERLIDEEVLKPICFDDLKDNRDFEILTDYNPPSRRRTKSQIMNNFECEKEFLIFRQALLKSIYHVTSTVPTTLRTTGKPIERSNGHVTDTTSTKTIDEVKKLVEELSSNWAVSDQGKSTFDGPITSRIPLCMEAKYRENVALLLRYCLLLMKIQMESFDEEDPDSICKQIITNLKIFMSSEMTLEVDAAEDLHVGSGKEECEMRVPIPTVLLKLNPNCIERSALWSEMFSIITLLLISLKSRVKDIKSGIQRRRRKKKKNSGIDVVANKIVETHQKFVDQIIELGNLHLKNLKDNQMQSEKLCSAKSDEIERSCLIENTKSIYDRISIQAAVSYSASFKQQHQVVELRLSNLNASKLY